MRCRLVLVRVSVDELVLCTIQHGIYCSLANVLLTPSRHCAWRGQGAVVETPGDHWMHLRAARFSNDAIDAWFKTLPGDAAHY